MSVHRLKVIALVLLAIPSGILLLFLVAEVVGGELSGVQRRAAGRGGRVRRSEGCGRCRADDGQVAAGGLAQQRPEQRYIAA